MYQLQPFESLKTVDSTVLVGRNQVKCTVWDDYVEKVMPFFRSDLLEPVVVLIQMGRIKLVEKSSEVKICSSYDATKLLFNQNTMDFVEFRESLCMQQQTPLKSITSNSTFSYGTTSRGNDRNSKRDEEFKTERFSLEDDAESPIATTSGKQNVAGNENEAVKRSLLDEFLSTQTSKQKKQIVVKEEKEPTGEQ
nr:uncharacterized protein LOC109155606 [Ipomoea trifida]